MTTTISPNQFIIEAPDWKTFFQSLSELDGSTTDKGHIFDRLTQLYLQASPVYKMKLKNVWLLRQVPPRVRKLLNLPGDDFGIDQIAETYDGEYWSIQSKFRADTDSALSYGELSTFSTLSFVNCNKINLALVSHTSMLPIRNRALLGEINELGLEKWSTIDQELWDSIRSLAKGKIKSLKPREKRKHQITAVEKVGGYFSKAENTRGRIIMPCGSGKSLVGFWAAEKLKAKSVLIAVPSLYLIGQTIKDWAREFLAKGEIPDWLVVCGNEKIAELNKDEFVGGVYELGVESTTKTEKIKKFISENSNKKKIIFSTYHSSKRLVDVASSVGFKFDLTICDEAHKTVGYREKPFAALVSDQRFKSKHRIFMTATEKVIRNNSEDVISMDEDSNDYGETIYFLSHGEAISSNPPIISDYRIVTLEIPEVRIKKLMNENEYLFEKGGEFEKAEAKDVGSCLAMINLFEKHFSKKAISFHSSIKRSEDYKKLSNKIAELLGYSEIDHYTVSSKLTPGKRKSVIDDFEQSNKALITNARCLNEGVDLPAVDSVIFADPKTSIVDIVQASGRALRVHEEKEYGFILVPLIIPENLDFEEFAQESNFRHIARTITALSIYDNRIVEQFKLVEGRGNGGVGGGPFIPPPFFESEIDINKFHENLFAKIWTKVGRANYRSYEEAREYAHGLNLSGGKEWFAKSKSGSLPSDIPARVNLLYKNKGWTSWGEFLGTGITATYLKFYRPFEEARAFVHNLGFKSGDQWRDYCKSGEKPDDIPTNAHTTYKDEGWESMGDWLGTGFIHAALRIYKPFEEARAFVHNLGFKSGDQWNEYCKSGEKPDDIPVTPHTVYKDKGWSGYGDWLGTGRIATQNRKYRSFEKARKFVRSLGLESSNEWREFAKSEELPDDIPSKPNKVYKDKGWSGYGDWLGTGRIANQNRKYRSFKEARKFVRSLDIKSQSDWFNYTKSGNKPDDIPANPDTGYKDKGWSGYGDWLGTGRVPTSKIKFLPFEEARTLVQKLGFKSGKEWWPYCKSGEKPEDIPSNPDRTYKDEGWESMGDWLGTGYIHHSLRIYKPFEQAKEFVHNLGLKSVGQWNEYCNSDNKPDDIPANPNTVYKENGWNGLGDWLGTGTLAPKNRKYRSFEKARKFVRSLGLKSEKYWREYTKSGNFPSDIPAGPIRIYKDKGWEGMGDWLGTGRIATQNMKYRSFKEARKFVRSLDIKSQSDWFNYTKSGNKPDDIPAGPWNISKIRVGMDWMIG